MMTIVQIASLLLAVAPSVLCDCSFGTLGGKFYIHTRENPSGVEIDGSNSSFDFVVSSSIKIITHGYLGDKDQYQFIVNAYLEYTDATVMSYEWKNSAALPEMDSAILAVALGEAIVNEFIIQLSNKFHLNSNQFHLVGYGSGAHLMGAAGRIQKKKLGRITGLDPSAKYFDGCSDINLPKLSPGDAEYVDIYHTDAGGLGMTDPIGTIDFYPGGGSYQPRCFESTSPNCDSLISIEYFAESIKTPDTFMARECSSFDEFIRGRCNKNLIAIAGEFFSLDATGTYYFQTNMGSPYGRKQNGTIFNHILLY